MVFSIQGYVTAEYAKEKGLTVKNLSGTKFRQMLRSGEEIPNWYSYAIIRSSIWSNVLSVYRFAFESVVKVLREEAMSADKQNRQYYDVLQVGQDITNITS